MSLQGLLLYIYLDLDKPPKMATEIERKYLVDVSKLDLSAAQSSKHIKQAYIMSTREKSVRVRTSGDCALLTIKGGSGIARAEFEYEIPLADAQELLKRFL